MGLFLFLFFLVFGKLFSKLKITKLSLTIIKGLIDGFFDTGRHKALFLGHYSFIIFSECVIDISFKCKGGNFFFLFYCILLVIIILRVVLGSIYCLINICSMNE